MQSHLTSLQRRHFQLSKFTRCRIQPWQIEQAKIISVLLVAADPLVIVDKIAAAIQDQFLAVDLERPRMVRGMSMDKIDSAVDEPMRKAHLFRFDAIAPVRAPVCGDDHHVTGLPYVAHPAAQLIGECLSKGGKKMDAWLILGGCPPEWDTAGWRAESEDQDPSTRPWDRNNGWRPSFA